jgi:hypothetical protein
VRGGVPATLETRSEAQYNAISDCNAVMTVDLTRNRAMNLDPSYEGSWGIRRLIAVPCHPVLRTGTRSSRQELQQMSNELETER